MPQNYIVPNIYQDMSNQGQGYFAFQFRCPICSWSIETSPIRSRVATTQSVMDIGVGLLGGFWGRAAEAGEQMYGSKWHQEQAEALQSSWAEVKHNFHYCPKCHSTVCTRCFNTKVNLCVNCAPDLKSDAASYQHELNIEAQRSQIQANYRAPQFNTEAVPSAVDDDMVRPPQGQVQSTPASPDGYPQKVKCPNCQHMGSPGKFCENCGTKLPWPDLFCPQCSSRVELTSRFCPECGTKLQQAN
ncbi:MAG TPA: zinc ribbon domain-containing protein [Ktedonobacteraceae bacterium]|nr:zinc ribbon domain-containing protein [Ktedonobacteraceae bacterium]